MLVRAILFAFVFFGGAVLLYRWWKASRALGTGAELDVFELRRMTKLAEKSKRMEAALSTRKRILDQAAKANMQELSARVDPVLRKLAQQVELQEDIAVILSELDDAKLEEEIREAEQTQAETKRAQLETQLSHLRSLRTRQTELDETGDRIVRELQNLHLALVNASATEARAQLESGGVQSSLAHLEEASNDLKHRAQAEDEIAMLVRNARSAASGHSHRS